MLTARFQKNPVFRNNFEGAIKMGSSRSVLPRSDGYGSLIIFAYRPETMVATLQMIQEKFGGAEGYIKAYTSLEDRDIEMLRRTLLVSV